ncbi:hypothetical protein G6F62_014671 [Rhizopus arrhizus]|nr:hypothetical protein G6F24_018598 [Rhizopus arrhizus]KAG1310192.1 hypothetical protein G6F62_014671 [Rhizopus arrhizus]
MSVKTYAPNQVKIVMGALPLSGLAEDTFVTVAEIGEGIASVAGVDGERKQPGAYGAAPGRQVDGWEWRRADRDY